MLTAKDLAQLPGRSESAKLKALYDDLNAKYFAGDLPRDTATVFFERELYPHLALAVGHAGRDNFGGWIVGIDSRLEEFDNILEIVLLHEMIHVESGTEGHGVRFQERFRELAAAGAFDRPFIGFDEQSTGAS